MKLYMHGCEQTDSRCNGWQIKRGRDGSRSTTTTTILLLLRNQHRRRAKYGSKSKLLEKLPVVDAVVALLSPCATTAATTATAAASLRVIVLFMKFEVVKNISIHLFFVRSA